MVSKEAIKAAITEFQKDFEDGEETNQWLTNVIEGLKQAEQDLKVLEIFKKHLGFRISDKHNDGYYIIFIDHFDGDYDYMCFAISEEEKDLLKEWEKNGR